MNTAVYFELANRASYAMPNHEAHEAIEIYYLTRGERLYSVENRTYALVAGTLILIGSHRIHKTSTLGSQSHERMLLEIPMRFVDEWRKVFPDTRLDFILNQSAVLCPPESPANQELQRLLRRICMLREQKPYGYEAEIRCETFRALLLFGRCAGENHEIAQALINPKHKMVYEIASYLSAHLGEAHSLDSICRRFFISKYYLCHTFCEVTGISMIAFLYAARAQRACMLLRESPWSISRIAQETGFGNPACFSAAFKKQMGLTPRDYRKQHRRETNRAD